jgi:hypothetical protein
VAQRLEDGAGAIPAAVVDVDDLGRLADRVERGGEANVEMLEHRLLVVGGHHDGERGCWRQGMVSGCWGARDGR